MRTISAFTLFLFLQIGSAQRTCLEAKRSDGAAGRGKDARELAEFDILHQTLELDLTLGDQIAGHCAIRWTPRVSGLNSITLDLEALTVDSVTSSNGTLTHTHDGLELQIALGAAVDPDDTLDLTVHYHGNPVVDGSGFGGFYTTTGITYNLGVAFESIPHSYGRVWFPCLDNFTERSTYELFIRTAGGRKAWCNGELVERTVLSGDTLLNHWRMDESVPAYLVSVAAANMVVARDIFESVTGEGVPVELIAAASDTTVMKQSFLHLPEAFAHFEELFGPYRWDRVGYVATPLGAMEHATSIHYPRPLINGNTQYEATMAHELAHHWFGNLVTCERAEEMYINEGAAEYLSYLFLEDVYGRERYMTEVRTNHRKMVHRAHLLDEGWWALAEMPQEWTYGEHSYNKGADVFHTLRSYLGDEAFSDGLSSFLEAYAFQPVNTEQLREHLEQVTGVPLTDFFNDWVLQPGWAAFEIDAQTITPGEDGWIAQLTIGQKSRGPADPYSNVPITVAFVGGNGQQFRDTVFVGGASTSLSFTVPFEPAWVWLNDDDRLALAVTAASDTIEGPGGFTSDIANFELALNAGTPVFARVEQYWVAPDEGTSEEPFAYMLSPDRYWRITGNWSDASRMQGYFYIDGRNTTSGNLDPGLIQDFGDIAFHEDSIVVLRRTGPDAPWRKWADDINTYSSPTDGFARMHLDSVLPGEYALAWRKSSMGLLPSAAPDEGRWTIAPNPATDRVTVVGDPAPGEGSLCVLDLRGAEVLRVALTGHATILATQALAPGRYILSVDRSGKRRRTIGELQIEGR